MNNKTVNKDIIVPLFHTSDNDAMKDANIFDEKLKTNLCNNDNKELYISTSPVISSVNSKSENTNLYVNEDGEDMHIAISPVISRVGSKSDITNLYENKDNKELYIATSPVYSTIDTKTEIVKNRKHDMCDDKCGSDKVSLECIQQFQLNKNISEDSFSTDGERIGYSSIKSSDTLSINDTNRYCIAADYSHNSIDASKTYLYVLSPTGTGSAFLKAVSDESLNYPGQPIGASASNSKCLDSDPVSLCVPEHRLCGNNDNVIRDSSQDLSGFDHTSEHIDLVRKEIDVSGGEIHGHCGKVNSDLRLTNNVEDSVDHHNNERSQIIWRPLPPDVQKKHGDPDSKMESPVTQVQSYVHVALDPSVTDKFVLATNQMLGVVPEMFSCNWEGCTTHTITQDDLIKHVNESHITCDQQQQNNSTNYTCFWKGCVREGKSFDARYKLVIHLRTHTGDKPHRCHMVGCRATFSRVENLKIHQRSHTGEKPYPCQFEGCNKMFANSSDRFKHKRTHTEKKPFRCTLNGCGKSYTDPSSLRKHKKRHLLEAARKRNEIVDLDRRKTDLNTIEVGE